MTKKKYPVSEIFFAASSSVSSFFCNKAWLAMGVCEIACQRHTSQIIAWLCSFNLEKAWQELVDSIRNDQFKKNIDRDRTYIYT